MSAVGQQLVAAARKPAAQMLRHLFVRRGAAVNREDRRLDLRETRFSESGDIAELVTDRGLVEQPLQPRRQRVLSLAESGLQRDRQALLDERRDVLLPI